MVEGDHIFDSMDIKGLAKGLHELHLVVSKNFAVVDGRLDEIMRRLDTQNGRLSTLESGGNPLAIEHRRQFQTVEARLNRIDEQGSRTAGEAKKEAENLETRVDLIERLVERSKGFLIGVGLGSGILGGGVVATVVKLLG